jgi:hypothetical protein
MASGSGCPSDIDHPPFFRSHSKLGKEGLQEKDSFSEKSHISACILLKSVQ